MNPPEGDLMPRGNTPRQPSRSGRHEGTRRQSRPQPTASPIHGSAGPRLLKSKSPTAKRAGASKKAAAYDPLAPERVRAILEGLDRMYPDVTCALTHKSAWELVVATILSAQCTDVRVNMVAPVLFKKYPTVQQFAALEPEELEPDIRSTGFFRNKSKSVVGAARKVVSDFGGTVPQTMEELLTLPGVARKTANVVLGTWFKKHEDAQKIEQDLMLIVPRERWTKFSHQVIWHGRKLCVARGPRCAECGLEKLCHAADKTWSTVEIQKNAKP